MKYLGVDYGTKRVGLSIGDSETKTAVVFGTANKVEDIANVVKEESINIIVLGKPYSVADKDHPMSEDFNKFVGALRELLPKEVKITFEDERLSSKYADSLQGGKKVKASRDEVAAVSILQGYLDQQ